VGWLGYKKFREAKKLQVKKPLGSAAAQRGGAVYVYEFQYELCYHHNLNFTSNFCPVLSLSIIVP
jgi:hypothetical protein